MATGKSHQIATLILAPAGAGAGYILSGDMATAGAVAAGVLFGLLVHPDRDLRVSKIDFDIAGYTFGLGLLWPIFWYPYSSLIPRHRHPLSHWPIVGTLGRCLYLGLLVTIATYLLGYGVLDPFSFWWMIPAGLGLASSDTLHWIMDGLPIW